MIRLIIFINIFVYGMWLLAESFGYLPFMAEHFFVSPLHMKTDHYWTLLTSVFSHNMFFHLLLNMFILNSFGTVILTVLGRHRFLAFYLVAGIVGSLSHCWTSAEIVGNPNSMALGASGAISGLIALFSFMFPRQKLLLLGFIPVPAFMGIILVIGLDIWGLTAQAGGGGLPIGHGAHLGGAFTGIIFYIFYIRKQLRFRR